ncbi:MAG: glutamine-hydrolyzing carbamoyl-phosphate synthase small subunit [bacterium]|nr:glutamine-hydrolyzing carbamoyl-phosphate synthase small subunit [bacterium]
MAKKCYLVLEDGTEFEGTSFGYESEAIGEAVFNTSMSGYQEILTDPSYSGQIVAMTYPMIGNYGVNGEDVESDRVQVAGFVVKEYSKHYSNFRATGSLGDYLIQAKIPAIEGIDTRRLTRHIRDKGAMRSGIFFDKKNAIDTLQGHPGMEGLDLATEVACKDKYTFGDNASSKPPIAVFDFGVKTNILRLLDKSGFSVTVYPGQTPLKQAISDGAKAVFLSNGPGDPDAVAYGKDLVKDIVKEEIPAFGICLGHQIMALGLGGKTYKLKFGHRGANQPVKDMETGQVEITSQNHGFAVDYESLKKIPDIEITCINLNDKTVEGIKHTKLPIMSVQHHPEANPGPEDSQYLFDKFYKMATNR